MGGKQEGRKGAALLFDHVLEDHGGDDGQGDNIPSLGQNLCDLFVLERRQASLFSLYHLGGDLCEGVSVAPARGCC